MGQITGGRISFGDGVKSVPGDQFSPTRKAEAEFTFSVAEGEDHEDMANRAMNLARAKVAEMLGTAAPAATTAVKTPPRSTKKADDDKAKYAAANAKPGGAAPAPAKPVAADAGIVIDEKIEETKPTPAEEDWGAALPETKTITDADLTGECSRTAARTKTPAKIREIIASYFDKPGVPVTQLPQEKRQEFIDKLKALPDAAA